MRVRRVLACILQMWLAAFRDGAARVRLGDDKAGDRGRTRVVVPPEHFLRAALVNIGGEGFDEKVLHCLCPSGVLPADACDLGGTAITGSRSLRMPIIGLLKITSAECTSYEGPTTAWHRESAVQVGCYHHPLDAYDVRVLDVRPLDVPYDIEFKRNVRHGDFGISKVSAAQPFFRPHWPQHEAGDIKLRRRKVFGSQVEALQCISARMLLRAWQIEGSAEDLPVLAVPFPIALLVVSGNWQYLVVLARWHRDSILSRNTFKKVARNPALSQGPIAGWPAPASQVWSNLCQHKAACDMADPALAMTPQVLENMAATIRKLRAGENGPEVLQAADRSVTVLDSWSIMLRGSMGTSTSKETSSGTFGYARKYKYDSDVLLECIRLASLLLGGASRLEEVVKRSLMLAAPPFLSKVFAESLGDVSKKLPHPSTIRRHEFPLDAAIQFYLRQRSYSKVVFRYGTHTHTHTHTHVHRPGGSRHPGNRFRSRQEHTRDK